MAIDKKMICGICAQPLVQKETSMGGITYEYKSEMFWKSDESGNRVPVSVRICPSCQEERKQAAMIWPKDTDSNAS